MNLTNEWLVNLSQAELLDQIPSNAIDSLDNSDKAAAIVVDDFLSGNDSRRRMKTHPNKEAKEVSFTDKSWQQLKKHFYRFLCTDDIVYADLRQKLRSSNEIATILIVATIAHSLGDKLGLVGGPLIALVAILINSCLRIGQQAFCDTFAADDKS